MQELVDLGARADVDAASRFVQDQHARIGEQPFSEHDLLLVTPAEAGDQAAWRAACRQADIVADSPDGPVDRSAIQNAQRRARERAQAGERKIVGHRRLEAEALEASVFCDERKAPGDPLRRAARQRRAIHEDFSRRVAIQAEDDSGKLGSPGAHEPEQAEDLSPVHRERNAADSAGLGHLAQLE